MGARIYRTAYKSATEELLDCVYERFEVAINFLAGKEVGQMAVSLCSAPINTARSKAPNFWGYQSFLAKPSCDYLTTFYDNGHCPATVRASERPAVVSFGWLQRDAFTTAQADYS